MIPNVSNYSNEFKDLYIRMISFKPERRPRLNEILNDPWFKEINDMSEEELCKLEEEIMEEFLALEEKKNKDNENIHSNQNTDYTDNASSNFSQYLSEYITEEEVNEDKVVELPDE